MGRISMPQGKGSQLHNRRDYEKIGKEIPDNIDREKTKDNIIIVDKNIREAYKEIFGEAVERYNEKQKRTDRKIDDYYDKIEHSKNGEKLFYEDVLQWGKKEDFEGNEQLKEKAKEALEKYARTFEERNPNLKVIGAYIHMDEASPHLHLDYVPVAHGYSRGLDTRNSLDKALKEQGIEVASDRKKTVKDKETGEEKEITLQEGRNNNATMAWKERERAYFGQVCQELGLEVEAERHLGRKQLTVEEFKEAEREMLAPITAEVDRQKEYAEALKEGGSYTNRDGERQYITYEQSLEHLENQKDKLTENVEAYEKGGFFYDYDKREGYSVPDGGIEKAVTDKREEAERIIGDAKDEAERIKSEAEEKAEQKIKEGNDKFEDMISRLDGYETSQKAQIDQEVEKYAQDQKNALEGKLEGLRGKLEQTREAITKNNEAINGQADTYSHNEKLLQEQTADLQELSQKLTDAQERLETATKELTAKEQQIQGLDKVTAKIRKQEYSIGTEQVGGMFNKRDVTVVEGISPKELERVFQRASLNQAAKDTVAQAEKTAQETLQASQRTIDEAQTVLQGQAQRQADLDALERKIKDRNKELLQENQKLQHNIKLYHSGWTDRDGNRHEGINQLRQDYSSLQAKYKGLQEQETEAMSNLKDLSEQADRKLAVIQSELSPEQMHSILSDSVATNLIQNTMYQTCLQLEDRGLLESGSAAFLKLDKKPLIERFKENTKDFLEKVKDHMEKMIEQSFHRSHGRSR